MQENKSHVENDMQLQRAVPHKALNYGSSFLDMTDDAESGPVSRTEEPSQGLSVLETIEKYISCAAGVDDGNEGQSLVIELPKHVLEHVKEWARCEEIRITWIDEVSSSPCQTNITLPKIPQDQRVESNCIYWCTPEFNGEDVQASQKKECSDPEIIAIALLYSIVLQLSRLLPEHLKLEAVKKDSELHHIQFEALDGSLESASVALSLIRELLDHVVADPICFIIRGLRSAESTATNPYLTELVEILRCREKNPYTSILFTTAEGSGVLSELIGSHRLSAQPDSRTLKI